MKLIKWLKMSFSGNRHDEKTMDLIVDLDEREKILLDEFLELSKEHADDIMVPRATICALPANGPLEQIRQMVIDHPFSRYPVYGENLDDIKGFVHIRDIAIAQMTKGPFLMETIMQKVLVVPESLSILNLLQKFKESRIHMSIVVDEYGSTNGLVTASDILRHLLGQTLEDKEMNDSDLEPHWVSDQTVILPGSYDLTTLIKEIYLNLTPQEKSQDPDTLNGYLQLLAGRVPDRMEVITNHQGIEFHVLEVNPRSVLKVKIVHPGEKLRR